ncbi:MAG: hypothetical protein JNK15_16715 [Planctomycetes bacterium]|nr:hypothetical protein [Planctomycetota bacterium]
MHWLPMSLPFVFAASLAAQGVTAAGDPVAALAAMAAADTTPERRAELHAALLAAEFRTFGGELARLLDKHPFLSGIGWSTATPWLEPRLTPGDRIAATLRTIWDAHTPNPLPPGVAEVLLDVLDDESAGYGRSLALQCLSYAPPMRERLGVTEAFHPGAPFLERALKRVRIDASPAFRAELVCVLAHWLAADVLADAALDSARSAKAIHIEYELWCRTGLMGRLEELQPATRRRVVHYAVDLMHRAEAARPGGAAHLVGLLETTFGMRRDAQSAWTMESVQRSLASVDAFVARGRPFLETGEVLAHRVRGVAQVDCRSQWRALDAHPMRATGVLQLGLVELEPLLPSEWPLPAGTSHTVRGERLAALAKRLSKLSWNDGAGGTKWGWSLHEHTHATAGELVVTVERRGDVLGLIAAGKLVLREKGRAGSRYGPNDLTCESNHKLALWLPLDTNSHITGFEFADDASVAGNFDSERFTQSWRIEAKPGDWLDADERRDCGDALVRFVRGDGTAAARLVDLGQAACAEILVAIAQTDDVGAKCRLTSLLRRQLGSAP